MKGSDTVAEMRIDYDLTIARANKIQALADSVRRVANDVQAIEDDTIGIWQGYAANTYRSQCDVLENELYNIEAKMNRLSETIIRIANMIKETDEQIAVATGNIKN